MIVSVIVAVSVVFCKRATTPTPSVSQRTDRRSPDKLEDIELASEHGFGRDFQRRSLEWRERGIRASLYIHEGDVQRLGKILIKFSLEQICSNTNGTRFITLRICSWLQFLSLLVILIQSTYLNNVISTTFKTGYVLGKWYFQWKSHDRPSRMC